MIQIVRRFFWEDSRTRASVYTGSILSSVIYAAIRTIRFHVSERHVAYEMLALLVAGMVVGIGVCFLRYSSFIRREYTVPRILRYVGAVACIILLAAPHVSISAVQAAIVNQRLEKAAVSVEPNQATQLPDKQLERRFNKISSIVETSIAYKIPANPDVIGKAQNNLESTLAALKPRNDNVRNSAVSAFVALVAYARANNLLLQMNVPTIFLGHGVTGNMMISQVPLRGSAWWQGSREGNAIVAMPNADSHQPVFPISDSTVVFNGVGFLGMGRPFIGTDNKSQVIVMNARIETATQPLDSIVWLNIKFASSVIRYTGGPLYLGNVSFVNCRFEFGADPGSQKVLEQINRAGLEPVNLVSGIN